MTQYSLKNQKVQKKIQKGRIRRKKMGVRIIYLVIILLRIQNVPPKLLLLVRKEKNAVQVKKTKSMSQNILPEIAISRKQRS